MGVNVSRLVYGAVFVGLFVGFELRIPAIVNLIPGGYGPLPYTGYLGLGFLLTGITALSSAYTRTPTFQPNPAMMGQGGPAGAPDPATMAMAAAMMAQAQQHMATSNPLTAPIACPKCGKMNARDAKFCSACAAPIPAPVAATPGVGHDQ